MGCSVSWDEAEKKRRKVELDLKAVYAHMRSVLDVNRKPKAVSQHSVHHFLWSRLISTKKLSRNVLMHILHEQ